MLSINYNCVVTLYINTCTQQRFTCRDIDVCLHDIFTYEYVDVMTFKYIY